MPYNPQIVDQRGQLNYQGAAAYGQGIASGISQAGNAIGGGIAAFGQDYVQNQRQRDYFQQAATDLSRYSNPATGDPLIDPSKIPTASLPQLKAMVADASFAFQEAHNSAQSANYNAHTELLKAQTAGQTAQNQAAQAAIVSQQANRNNALKWATYGQKAPNQNAAVQNAVPGFIPFSQ